MELSELQIGQWYKIKTSSGNVYYYTPLQIINNIIGKSIYLSDPKINKGPISNSEFWRKAVQITISEIPEKIREVIPAEYQTNNNYQIY